MTERKKVYHSNFFAMGTRMDVVLPLIDNEKGDLVFNKIKAETGRLEKKLSRFDADGEIFKINQSAHEKPFEIDTELHSVLSQSMDYFEATNGYFDTTARPLLESHIKNTVDPEFKTIKKSLGLENIVLEKDTLFFRNNIVELDLGGFGKGYALEKIKSILLGSGIETAFVSFGESSILTLGKHPFGEFWGVGIKHLFNYENVHTFSVIDKSLSTSGITPDNKKKHGGQAHIINPKTGKTTNNNRTITVVSDSPLDAEVLSTALMVCGEDEKKEIIDNFTVDEVVEINYNNDYSYESRYLFKKN